MLRLGSAAMRGANIIDMTTTTTTVFNIRAAMMLCALGGLCSACANNIYMLLPVWQHSTQTRVQLHVWATLTYIYIQIQHIYHTYRGGFRCIIIARCVMCSGWFFFLGSSTLHECWKHRSNYGPKRLFNLFNGNRRNTHTRTELKGGMAFVVARIKATIYKDVSTKWRYIGRHDF